MERAPKRTRGGHGVSVWFLDTYTAASELTPSPNATASARSDNPCPLSVEAGPIRTLSVSDMVVSDYVVATALSDKGYTPCTWRMRLDAMQTRQIKSFRHMGRQTGATFGQPYHDAFHGKPCPQLA